MEIMMMAETQHICSNNIHVDGDGELQQQQKSCLSGMDRYDLLKVINWGSYGVVYKGLDKLTGETVAIKYEKHGLSKSTLREIFILACLPQHPSIVGLRDVIVDERRHNHALVVMECMDSDLQKWIGAARRPLTVSEMKMVMKKILEGVAFLHGMGVMHRDLKPGNILINSLKGDVKICDFGLSRMESKSGLYTARRVGTLWYRAPEILSGLRNYTTAVDMWSVGCIMAELLLREALFPGRSEIHQFCLIHDTVGISPYNLHRKVTTAVCVGGMPVLSAAGADLLEGLLAFDPKNRMTASEALNHSWFNEFYGLIPQHDDDELGIES